MTKNVLKKPTKKQKAVVPRKASASSEAALFKHVSAIIEKRRYRAGAYANREITLMYWEIGKHIGSALLAGQRGEYGKQIVSSLSTQLEKKYGKCFELRNLRRMVQFSSQFSNFEIVSTLSTQLSWSHIVELLPLKTTEAKLYYAQDVAERSLSIQELRHQISRKAYERREIANNKLSNESSVPFNIFKDPYLLDVLGLKENFLEADLEKSVLIELVA